MEEKIKQAKEKLDRAKKHLQELQDKLEIMWSTDYAAVELRVITAVVNDRVMIKAYQNGEDLHYKTAQGAFKKDIPKTQEEKDSAEADYPNTNFITSKERTMGKTANFSIVYGSGDEALLSLFKAVLPKITIEEIQILKKGYLETYPDAAKYINNAFNKFNSLIPQERTIWMADGRCIKVTNIVQTPIRTLLGRKLMVDTPNKMLNFPVQSSAAECFKLAVLHMGYHARKENVQLKVSNQVHDDCIAGSNLFEFDKAAQIFRNAMEWSINYVTKHLFYTPVEQDFLVLSCCGVTFGEYEGTCHTLDKMIEDITTIYNKQIDKIKLNEYLKDLIIDNDKSETT